jgi:CYTH domain-containing protein
VDVFLGALYGLILAETDFDDDAEMDNFPKPSFASRDVTRDELFTGGHLAYTTIDELRAELNSRMKDEG